MLIPQQTEKTSGTCNIKLLTLLVSCIVLVNVHLSVLVPNPHKGYEGVKGIQLKIELNRAIKSVFELYMDQFLRKIKSFIIDYYYQHGKLSITLNKNLII